MAFYRSSELSVRDTFHLLSAAVAPRPIALVATCDSKGRANVSPFSFYNVFGVNPPMLAFSPARSGRDGSFKDTYYNIKETGECTVQVVTRDIVDQVNLSSVEYDRDVDEFVKSGLTPLPSQMVAVPRVKESPIQMECKLSQIIALGEKNGSGNLVICEVVAIHVDESVLSDGHIDIKRLDLVGRNGGNFYTHAAGAALFEVAKPKQKKAIGFEDLPEAIRTSMRLTANEVAQIAMWERVPDQQELLAFKADCDTMSEPLSEDWRRELEVLEHSGHYHKMFAIALQLKDADYHDGLAAAIKLALRNRDVKFAVNAAFSATVSL